MKPLRTEHVDVAVDTVLGDHYELAFMSWKAMHEVLAGLGTTPSEGDFMMVNMSHACLSIPWRIVNAISVRNRSDTITELWQIVWTRQRGISQEKVTEH